MQARIEDTLIDIITKLIAPLGYEVVSVEIQTHRQKTLRLFIDFGETPKPNEKGETPAIGIEDCVKVSKALDEPLDLVAEIEGIFHGAYELEVSSPGVDRPLRRKKDYERYAGRKARLHTYRALSQDEVGDAAYFAKNPKQKNFIGVLNGLSSENVLLTVGSEGRNAGTELKIPLSLISKANLEPAFEF